MYPVPVVLFSIVDTETWSLEQLRTWADQLIGLLSRPAPWLLDVSTSRTLNDAVLAIRQGLNDQQVVLPDNIGDLLVGFLALRHKREQLHEQHLAAAVGDVLDAYNGSRIDVELWYRLSSNGGKVTAAMKEVTDELARVAAEAEDLLHQVDVLASDSFFSAP